MPLPHATTRGQHCPSFACWCVLAVLLLSLTRRPRDGRLPEHVVVVLRLHRACIILERIIHRQLLVLLRDTQRHNSIKANTATASVSSSSNESGATTTRARYRRMQNNGSPDNGAPSAHERRDNALACNSPFRSLGCSVVRVVTDSHDSLEHRHGLAAVCVSVCAVLWSARCLRGDGSGCLLSPCVVAAAASGNEK